MTDERGLADEIADRVAERLDIDTRPLLTYAEAAERLNVSERTVWGLVKSGELAALRVGGSVRIEQRAIDALLAEQREASDGSC